MAQYMTSGGKGILARGTVVDILLIGIAVALATVVFSDRRPERLLLSTSDWDAALDGTSRIGSKDARVTVVEFVDYECPACYVAEGVLSELTSQFPGRIQRIVRHFPLTRIHPRAEAAAKLALCAAKQGAFSRIHGPLFEARLGTLETRWDTVIAAANLADSAAVRRCLSSQEVANELQRELAIGRRLGVSGTPTFIVDREWLRGVDAPSLRALLYQRLRG